VCRAHATASPWWLRGGIALPITIVVAAVSYRWLETPFLRLKNSLGKAQTQPAL
jgi:peptidoglycan/LPS O-acetylase OafA/YrhL